MQRIFFLTSDNVRIAADYYKVPFPRFAVLMLHMMPSSKEAWRELAEALGKENIASLAIDLRGHGQSLQKGRERLDFKLFEDKEHQASKNDVEAALEWLKAETGFGLSSMAIVGASIGANLALQSFARHPEITKCAAISPGLNYRGIEPKSLVNRYQKSQRVLYITARDDQDGKNTPMTEELYAVTSCQKEIIVCDQGGHGTNLLALKDVFARVRNFLAYPV